MADNGDFVTRREFDQSSKNIEQSLKRIEVTVAGVATDLKEFKEILNPAFNKMQQQLKNHIERDNQRRKERWSPWQIAMTAIAAVAAVGMFIVALVK